MTAGGTAIQQEIQFPSYAPINAAVLGGQNGRLYEYLQVPGRTIHCFHPARVQLKIGYLNSRVADLIKAGVQVYKRYITVRNAFGDEVSVVEYSLYPFSF